MKVYLNVLLACGEWKTNQGDAVDCNHLKLIQSWFNVQFGWPASWLTWSDLLTGCQVTSWLANWPFVESFLTWSPMLSWPHRAAGPFGQRLAITIVGSIEPQLVIKKFKIGDFQNAKPHLVIFKTLRMLKNPMVLECFDAEDGKWWQSQSTISKALIKDDETYPDSNDEDGNVTIPLNKRW